jgi:hypothetical protein
VGLNLSLCLANTTVQCAQGEIRKQYWVSPIASPDCLVRTRLMWFWNRVFGEDSLLTPHAMYFHHAGVIVAGGAT